MGTFSWLRANVDTEKANIAWGDKYACLIPKAKELCKKEGIDFKNFLEHDNFDSKQPDKKIKKNIEKDI